MFIFYLINFPISFQQIVNKSINYSNILFLLEHHRTLKTIIFRFPSSSTIERVCEPVSGAKLI